MNLLWLGALSHSRAREVLAAAFQNIWNRAGSLPELQYAQAVSLGEGGQYGSGCYRNLATGQQHCNINNWGALQCKALPPCPPGCVEATDSEHGTASSRYQACFRVFATPEEGAAAFLRRLYRGGDTLRLAGQGRFQDAVDAQRATGYFTLSADRYWEAVDKNVDRVAAALNEPRGDRAGVRLIARGRALLPYAVAAAAVGAGAYYLFPQQTRGLARRTRAVVGL